MNSEYNLIILMAIIYIQFSFSSASEIIEENKTFLTKLNENKLGLGLMVAGVSGLFMPILTKKYDMQICSNFVVLTSASILFTGLMICDAYQNNKKNFLVGYTPPCIFAIAAIGITFNKIYEQNVFISNHSIESLSAIITILNGINFLLIQNAYKELRYLKNIEKKISQSKKEQKIVLFKKLSQKQRQRYYAIIIDYLELNFQQYGWKNTDKIKLFKKMNMLKLIIEKCETEDIVYDIFGLFWFINQQWLYIKLFPFMI